MPCAEFDRHVSVVRGAHQYPKGCFILLHRQVCTAWQALQVHKGLDLAWFTQITFSTPRHPRLYAERLSA